MDRLVTRFAASAAQRGRKIALITDKNQLSYDDLVFLVDIFDIQLRTRGVKPGQTVVLDSGRPEFVVVMLLVASRMSLRLVLSRFAAVRDAGVAHDFVLSTDPLPDVDAGRAIVIDDDWFATLGSGALPDIASVSGEGCECITTTSGSTGIPKFIAAKEAVMVGSRYPGVTPSVEHRFHSTMSIRQRWTVMSVLRHLFEGGSAVVLGEGRNRFLPYLDMYGVTHLQTTPAIVAQMLDVPHPEQYLASLRTINISGAFCSHTLQAALAARCTADISAGYGASEIGGICRAVFDRSGQRPEGYLGRLYRDDIDIAFFDDALEIIPDASEGIVGFRKTGGELGRSYIAGTDAADKTGYIKGYFIPGDIIRRDGDDLYFLGRTKNIINQSGNKFSLERVQSVLDEAGLATLVGCAAITDAYQIEHLIVYYQGRRELTVGRIQDLLTRQLPGLKVSKAVQLDQMPLTATGKIDQAALRLMAQQAQIN